MLKKLLLILLLTTTSCQDQKEQDALKVATSPDYPPFEYKKDGKLTGFDVELAQHVAEKLNKKLEIHELDFNSLIPALQAGKVDLVISALSATPERLINNDFSDVYYQAGIAIISKKETNIDSFANKIVGVQLGSIMENFIRLKQEYTENIKIRSLSNNLHLLQELKLNRVDILLLEEGQVKEIMASNNDLKVQILPKSGYGYAIALKQNSPLKEPLNDAIVELKKENIFTHLEEKYLHNNKADNKSTLIKSFTQIPLGIFTTLKYALISVSLGLIFGTLIALSRISNIKLLQLLSQAYVSIFRGTPLLVQLYIVYFALPGLLKIEISAFAAGIIAFSLNSAAYASENIRGGIASVDKGQFEAAKSLGMPYWMMMRYIIMPQALKNILPSLVNEAINMVKESSIISFIGEADITRRANIVASEQYNFLQPLLVAALCYYILVVSLNFLTKLLEKRFKTS
jgi:arginine/lysine/histidine transporter system substrate-binding protein